MSRFVVEASSDGIASDNSVRRVGEFDTREEAIACAKRLIDGLLLAHYRADMYPGELMARFRAAGESIAIFQDDDATVNVRSFNPQEYAMQRCQEYCGKSDPA